MSTAKPPLDGVGGFVVIGNYKLTPKQAIAFTKSIKKVIAEIKKNYCQKGHELNDNTSEYVMLKNGYMARRCMVCRKHQSALWYEQTAETRRKYARDRQRKLRGTYACSTD